MKIRQANKEDVPSLQCLLHQVLNVHHQSRPDLFQKGASKYTDEELMVLLQDEKRPVFVAENEQKEIVGYAFCILQQLMNHNIMTDIKTLYLDDLCVDEKCRGQGIGKALFQWVQAYAKQQNCYNLTLNVWACNVSAMRFYQSCGLQVQKIGLEEIV